MSQVACRLAVPTDFPVLSEMYCRLYDSYYQYNFRLPRPADPGSAWLDSFSRTLGRFSSLYVAEVDGSLCGYLLCRVKRTPQHLGAGVLVGEISDVWLEPERRGLGIAGQLIRLALDWLRQQNVHSVEAQVLKGNQASLSFFQGMGFEEELSVVRLAWEDYAG
mgnify:FL=1